MGRRRVPRIRPHVVCKGMAAVTGSESLSLPLPTHCQAEPSHRSRGGTPGSRPPSAAAHAQVTSAHEAARKADAAAAWEPGPDHRAPADPERREPASAERRALAGAERSIDGGHGSGCPCCEAMALWERAEEQLWGAVAIP